MYVNYFYGVPSDAIAAAINEANLIEELLEDRIDELTSELQSISSLAGKLEAVRSDTDNELNETYKLLHIVSALVR